MTWGQSLTFKFLVLLACALPWDVREPYVRLGAVTLTTAKIPLLICAIFGALGLPRAWRRLDVRGRGAMILALLWVAGNIASALAHEGGMDMMKFAARLGLGVGVMLAAAGVGWTPGRLRILGWGFGISGCLAAGLGLLQASSGPEGWRVFHFFGVVPVTVPETGALRASGTMLDPTSLAMILVAALPWAARAFTNPSVLALASMTLLGGILATQSRWPATVAALGLLVVARIRPAARSPMLAGGVLALILSLLFVPAIRYRWGWPMWNVTEDPFLFHAPPPAASPGGTARYAFTVTAPAAAGWPEGVAPQAEVRVREYASGRILASRPVRIPPSIPGTPQEVGAEIPVPSAPGVYLVEIYATPGERPTPRVFLTIRNGRAAWSRAPAARSPSPDPPRWTLWQAALSGVAAHPWLGLGPETFRQTWHRYVPDAEPDPRYSPHNILLEAWVNAGAVGGIPFTALVGLLIWKCVGALRRGGPSPADGGFSPPAVPAACLSWLGWCAVGMTESFFQSTSLLAGFWLAAGLSLAPERGEGEGEGP